MNRIVVLALIFLLLVNGIASVHAQQPGSIPSPLKQIKLGVMPQDVKCRTDFVLIIKKENGYPACVRSDTENKLVIRGWSDSSYKQLVLLGTVNASSLQRLVPNNNMQVLPPSSNIPLPPIAVTPNISSSKIDVIKIISIGMSPNPLKIGDIPEFTITYQNISDKSIYGNKGRCGNLVYSISPSHLLQEMPALGISCPVNYEIIKPNQTVTELGGAYKGSGYKIIQTGLLNVTLNLDLHNNSPLDSDIISETIRFSVNTIK